MQTELLSVSKIFTERIFRIPDYQRGYAWSDRQLQDYWNDITQIPEGKNHYCGVLMLEDVYEEEFTDWSDDLWIIKSKSYKPFFVVDGQQRLTTTIILIQAICDTIPNEKKLNYTTIDEIRKKYIFEQRDDSISRSYIFGYQKDNPSYEYLKTKIFLERSDEHAQSEETIYTQNLLNSKNFFIEKIKEMDFSSIETLYRKITQSLLFNIYAISKDVNTYIAFETLNNRGKPLTLLELLKTRLIYLSTVITNDEHDQRKLRSNVNEAWKAIYHYLGKNKDKALSDDYFLFCHYLIYFHKEKKENVYYYRRYLERQWDIFKESMLEEIFNKKRIGAGTNTLTIEEINKYAQSLRNCVRNFFNITNPEMADCAPEIRKILQRMQRINAEGATALIMSILSKDKEDGKKLEALTALERYTFLTNFKYYRHYGSVNDEFFIKLASLVYSGEFSIDKSIKEINEASTKMLDDLDYARNRFSQDGFYDWPAIRYFLYEYELSLQEKTKNSTTKLKWEEYSELGDYESVEHIYPQNPRHIYWREKFKDYSTKQKKAIRNSLGNLLPVSKRKNASLSNKPFSEKKGDKQKNIGYAYGCYSEIAVSLEEDWGIQEIQERGLKMLEFMEKRWNFSIGSTEQKIKTLGLPGSK